jgi:hypothetical protein
MVNMLSVKPTVAVARAPSLPTKKYQLVQKHFPYTFLKSWV